MAGTGERARRWQAIQKMIDDGESADKIAAATGVHRRTVFRRKKKPAPDFPLFDFIDTE
nr:helix-turn-helix domain-containing protein [Kordiimonas marina]